MNIELIGNWAGQVWNVLDAKGAETFKQVKKETKLKEKELYAAIGWLGREGKLNLAEKDGELVISLNK